MVFRLLRFRFIAGPVSCVPGGACGWVIIGLLVGFFGLVGWVSSMRVSFWSDAVLGLRGCRFWFALLVRFRFCCVLWWWGCGGLIVGGFGDLIVIAWLVCVLSDIIVKMGDNFCFYFGRLN